MQTELKAELNLRRLQLTEIRAMLGLTPDTPHEHVISNLIDIGNNAKKLASAINVDATPARYLHRKG